MGALLTLKDSASIQLALCCHSTDFSELAEDTYRVQALSYGSWVHPNDPEQELVIDEEIVDNIIKNFNDGVLDSVTVPWRHTDHPAENTGRVIAAVKAEDGLDLILNTPEAVDQINKELVGGVSLQIDFEYVDKRTGAALGPTMIHCALVSNPYIKGMRKFAKLGTDALKELGIEVVEQKIAAGDALAVPLFLQDQRRRTKPGSVTDSESGDDVMTLDELLALLKSEHSIDVTALQEQVQTGTKERTTVIDELKKFGENLHIHMDVKATPKDLVASFAEPLKKALDAQIELLELRKAVASKVTLTDGQKLTDLVVAQIDDATALTDRVLNLEAEKAVESLITDKKILPAEKDHYMELRRSNVALFDKMTKDKKQVTVALGEQGADTSTDGNGDPEGNDPTNLSDDKVGSEIGRYSKQASETARHGLAGVIAKRKPQPA